MNTNTRKLSDDQIRTVRMWWKVREEAIRVPTPRVVAKRLGVSPGTLYSIGRGERYKEVR